MPDPVCSACARFTAQLGRIPRAGHRAPLRQPIPSHADRGSRRVAHTADGGSKPMGNDPRKAIGRRALSPARLCRRVVAPRGLRCGSQTGFTICSVVVPLVRSSLSICAPGSRLGPLPLYTRSLRKSAGYSRRQALFFAGRIIHGSVSLLRSCRLSVLSPHGVWRGFGV